jgi:hypothetical protein
MPYVGLLAVDWHAPERGTMIKINETMYECARNFHQRKDETGKYLCHGEEAYRVTGKIMWCRDCRMYRHGICANPHNVRGDSFVKHIEG